MPEAITDNLDLWTSALLTKSTAGRGSNGKLEAYGIKKLRELILELAACGKLVPQDTNDEPASVLLGKIAKEKSKLIKAGKIKQEKPFPAVDVDDTPYTLPANWAWARLPDISSYKPGKTPSTKNPSYWSENSADVPWVSISDMEHFGVITETSKRITPEAAKNVFGYEPVPKGSLLMSFKLTVGKLAILGVDAYHNEAILSIHPYSGIERDYLFKVLPIRAQEGNTKRAIMGNTLNATSLALLLIPIPPSEEQHRIVAKVDELMALCDQLEQQQTDSIAAHQAMVETLLGTLTRVESQQEFSEAWVRIANHFDTLFTTEASIDQLKQTILQLAVMGKLVPQDPNDEPAQVLVEKIVKAKGKLAEEGVIRKQDTLPEIESAETPFSLPAGWSFVRLGDLSKVITKGSSPKWQGVSYTDNPDDILFVTSENVGSYALLWDNKKYVEKKFNEVEPRSILGKGDFLMNIVGASIGRTAIYDIDVVANINQAVCLIRVFSEFLDSKFLLHFFNSAICVSYMFDKQVDNARANLSMGNIAKFVIPFPPLAEQHRIVAKVDELMSLCDTLKARLADAQATQIHLADAIVELVVA